MRALVIVVSRCSFPVGITEPVGLPAKLEAASFSAVELRSFAGWTAMRGM